jgi:hypothetical protein
MAEKQAKHLKNWDLQIRIKQRYLYCKSRDDKAVKALVK